MALVKMVPLATRLLSGDGPPTLGIVGDRDGVGACVGTAVVLLILSVIKLVVRRLDYTAVLRRK
jgi:hypothetical protein